MRQVFITITAFFISTIVSGQILYECKSPTNDTVVYILGTCHRLPKKVQIDTVLLANLIRISEVVFSELYIDDGDTSYKRISTNLSGILRFKNNGVLSDSVTKNEYEQIQNYYKKNYGISTKQFRWSSYYQPWLMHQKLTKSDKTYYLLDNLIYGIAKRTKNKIVNLDNEQLQVEAYEWLNKKHNIEWLLNLTGELGAKELVDDEMIEKHYLLQDTAAIALIRREVDDPKRQQLLIDNRNKHWQAVLDRNLRRTNFLYGGLAHVIFGEYSLLNYFKTKQYTVKALEIAIRRLP